MEMFQEMNRKLDEGWKLTDSCCQECKSVVMYNPHKKTLVCLSNKHQNSQRPFEAPKEEPSEPSDNGFVEITNEVFKKSKTDDISKKLGQKLVQGWAMLQDACMDCNVPIMKSKKGEMICFGCNRPFIKESQIQEKPKQKPIEPKQSPIPKSDPSNSLTKQKPKIQKVQIQQSHQSNTLSSLEASESLIITTYKCFQKRIKQHIQNQDNTKLSDTLDLLNRFLNISQKMKKIQN